MMTIQDIQKIRETFNIEPIPTRGNQKGVILKFYHPYFYIKIYDLSEGDYTVQVWKYGKQLPERVDNVKSRDLIKYIKNVRLDGLSGKVIGE